MQFTHYIKLCVNCFGKTMLYMCIEYHVYVNMYDASTQGTDEHIIYIYIHHDDDDNNYYYYNYMSLEWLVFVVVSHFKYIFIVHNYTVQVKIKMFPWHVGSRSYIENKFILK